MSNTLVTVVASLLFVAFLGLWFKVAALETNQGPHMLRLQAVAFALHIEVERLQKGECYERVEGDTEAADKNDGAVEGM